MNNILNYCTLFHSITVNLCSFFKSSKNSFGTWQPRKIITALCSVQSYAVSNSQARTHIRPRAFLILKYFRFASQASRQRETLFCDHQWFPQGPGDNGDLYKRIRLENKAIKGIQSPYQELSHITDRIEIHSEWISHKGMQELKWIWQWTPEITYNRNKNLLARRRNEIKWSSY